MKSMTRRPSLNRPAGEWKNVSPLGEGAEPKAAEMPPVSEFESPKLNMAGKLQGAEVEKGTTWLNAKAVENKTLQI